MYNVDHSIKYFSHVKKYNYLNENRVWRELKVANVNVPSVHNELYTYLRILTAPGPVVWYGYL